MVGRAIWLKLVPAELLEHINQLWFQVSHGVRRDCLLWRDRVHTAPGRFRGPPLRFRAPPSAFQRLRGSRLRRPRGCSGLRCRIR